MSRRQTDRIHMNAGIWRAAALALSLLLSAAGGGCRATTAGPTAAGAASAPEAARSSTDCAARPLAFRPRAGVTYHARVEEKRGVYRSSITYTADGSGGWTAVERAFSLRRPGPVETRWSDISKGELRWKLDGRGVPVGEPEQAGYVGPCCLESFSFLTFAPVGIANPSSCAGTAWDAHWVGTGRERSFRFRIEREGGAGESATVSVAGLIKTSANEWKVDGTLEVLLEDGLTGGGTLHVGGPGAPAVNDLSRQIHIAPAAD